MTKEYTIQYRFKPRGCWYIRTYYDNLGFAKGELERFLKRAKENPGIAQFWRVAEREVSGWKEAK